MMKNLLADQIPLGNFQGFGPLGNPLGTNGIHIFTKFLSTTIGLMTIIAIIWFIFVLITGAIGWISAGSDKAAVETARKKIANGLIGLVVVIGALFIIDLVGYLLGINNILNLGGLFELILPGGGGGGANIGPH